MGFGITSLPSRLAEEHPRLAFLKYLAPVRGGKTVCLELVLETVECEVVRDHSDGDIPRERFAGRTIHIVAVIGVLEARAALSRGNPGGEPVASDGEVLMAPFNQSLARAFGGRVLGRPGGEFEGTTAFFGVDGLAPIPAVRTPLTTRFDDLVSDSCA